MSSGPMIIPASPGYEWITSQIRNEFGEKHRLERIEVIAFAVIFDGDDEFTVKPISATGDCNFERMEEAGKFTEEWTALKLPSGHCFVEGYGLVASSVRKFVKKHKFHYASTEDIEEKPKLSMVK